MRLKTRLFATTLAGMVTAASAASAQTESNNNTIAEIVVTAEKRDQSLQDVPVAVSAFTDERREVLGIANAQDLTNFTPGLNYNTGNDRMTMRGIGRLTNNRASEGGVAMYNDNFFTSSVYSFSKSNLFVDRIEVLRGPQGTLYGRNAIGGAMNVISKRPTDDYYAEVRGTFANYDTQQYEAAASGPLFGNVRGRVAGSYINQGEGYFRNIAGGPSEGGRGEVWLVEAQLDGSHFDGKFEWWAKYEHSKTDALGRGAGGRQGVTYGRPNVAAVVPGGPNNVLVPGTTPTSAWANFNRTAPLASEICDRCFESDSPNQINIESQTYTLQAVLHLENMDIRYIAGRTWYHYELTTDVDGTANSTPFRVFPGQVGAPGAATGAGQIIPTGGALFYPRLENQYDEEPLWFSNELNFSSTHTGPVQWLIGLYQFREESNYTPIDARVVDDARFETPRTPFGALAAVNPNRSYALATGDTRSESYAAFGQVDWNITDELKLTAGLRYTKDQKTVVEGARLICFMSPSPACPAAVSRLTGMPIDFTQFAVGVGTQVDPSVTTPVFLDPATGLRTRVLRNEWSAVGGTLGFDWQPDDDTLVYSKYSRGYKAGGFNATTTTLSPLVTTKEETVDAFEVGAKKTVAGNLQVNASAFIYKYNDLQAVMSTFDPIINGNTSLYANLPKATIKGFEVETIWQPVDNLQINANYAYLDAKVDEGCCYQDPENPGGGLQDLAGNRLGASTPHRVSFNANYTWELGLGELTASASYVWRSDTYFSVFNEYYNEAKAFEQIDARVIFNDVDDRFTVIGFAKNITDVRGAVVMGASRNTNLGPNNGFINQSPSFIAPRTYGVEVQYRF